MNLINVLKHENQNVVSSRDVAEKFRKQHNNVLQTIDNIITENPVLMNTYFIQTSYKAGTGRNYKEFLLTRDGFSLLAMGFTGNEAMSWKIKYIEAFNKMEEHIKQQTPQISLEQQLVLSIYKGDIEGVEAAKKLVELKTKPLIETIEIQKPMVDIYQKLMDTQFTFTSTQMSKCYGLNSAIKLNKMMNDSKLIYKQGKSWHAYANVSKDWYKEVASEYGTQLRFTGKGMIEISKILDLPINEEQLQGGL